MLTVLIRYKNGDRAGREVLTPARSVEFVPKDSKHDEPGLLINLAAGGDCDATHLSPSDNDDDWRDVFIMNAEGQTVARYIL